MNRFRGAEADDMRAELEAAHGALAKCAGYQDGEVARNLDEPELWCLITKWRDVGSYRRALSTYDVKMHVVPTLSKAIDEPSAYEVAGSDPFNEQRPRELF